MLMIVDFLDSRNFLASFDGCVVIGVVERKRDDLKTLFGEFLVHLEHVREVFLARAACRRPGIDQRVLDLLVLAQSLPGIDSS